MNGLSSITQENGESHETMDAVAECDVDVITDG